MSSKTYRLKVRKVPLPEDIIYRQPNFPAFQELHLDLLENKDKLKKNPPKPIFVPPKDPTPSPSYSPPPVEDEEFTLEELEKAYDEQGSEQEEVFEGREEPDYGEEPPSEPEPEARETYTEQQFEVEGEPETPEEERERNEHADLLFKFMVLRRKYPNVEIPEFTEHSDIGTMRRVYDHTIRRVSLDSSVENYKQYLTGGFMVMEWIATNMLGIDLSGFTQQQMKATKYDRLLIELGEKNYSTAGSRFPVEVRLLFLIVFNAGLFYIQKRLFSGGGTGGGDGGGGILGALFGGLQGDNKPQPQRKRRMGMRGPTITPSEVEDLAKQRNDSPDEDDEDD